MREVDDNDLDNVAGGGAPDSNLPNDGGIGGSSPGFRPSAVDDSNEDSGSNTGGADSDGTGGSGGSSMPSG